jgi:hypothetical protein
VVKLVEGCTTKQTLINIDDALEIMMGVWEIEHRQRSVSFFSSRFSALSSTLSPNHQESDNILSPNHLSHRQSSLLGSLVGRFSSKQRELKLQREDAIKQLFNECDAEMNPTESIGELTLPQFEMLIVRMGHNLNDRRSLALFNEWGDFCENAEDTLPEDKELDKAGRLACFVSIMIANGLLARGEYIGTPIASSPVRTPQHALGTPGRQALSMFSSQSIAE